MTLEIHYAEITNITFLKGKKGVLSRHFYARVMVPQCNGFTEEKPKAGM